MVHSHSHDSHAHRGSASFGRAFAIGITLNLGFVIIEAIYGFLANSMALLADAGHNFSDVLSLALAWGAVILARRPPSPRFSYGLSGGTILAALANSILLLIAVGFIAYHSIMRLIIPDIVASGTIIVVAGVGIVVNGLTAFLFARGRRSDLNVRGAYLHMVADALISAGVVAAGVVMQFTGWLWVDSAASLIVVALIFVATADMFRESLTMALAGVPRGIEPDAVEKHLLAFPQVARIHDLHIWPMSTTEFALTAHLVMPEGFPGDSFLQSCAHSIHHQFGISHSTFQVETGNECELAPSERL